jgi:hypothetical protein
VPARLRRFLQRRIKECAEINAKRKRKIEKLLAQLSAVSPPRGADALRASLAELEATPELEPHPMLRELLDKTDIVVDVFHFNKSHKVGGSWVVALGRPTCGRLRVAAGGCGCSLRRLA